MITPPSAPTRASSGAIDLADPRWQRAVERARREQPASDPLTSGPATVLAWKVTGRREYVVTRRPDGSWSCTCEAGQHGAPCKHAGHCYVAYVARPTYVDVRRRYGAALADWLYAELIALEPCRECGEQPAAVETGRCIDCAQDAA